MTGSDGETRHPAGAEARFPVPPTRVASACRGVGRSCHRPVGGRPARTVPRHLGILGCAISNTCEPSPQPGRGRAIVQRSVAQLPWRHHVALLEKLDNTELRLWYGQAAVEQGWSRDVLVHHIEGRFHQRAGRAITNFARAIPPPDSDLAHQSMTSRPSGCCCARQRTTSLPSTPFAVTPRPSASRSGRPPSPRACPRNSNPACPHSKNSKLNWPTTSTGSRTEEKTNDRIQ